MKRNNLLAKFIITWTLVALLTIPVGRVTGVFALALPQEEIMPIYDTTIVQLRDYVDNNLTDSQLDIYNVLLGLFLVSQAAAGDYELIDPYANSSDVFDWLKSCGIQLHNSLIGFIPDNMIISVGNKAYNIGDLKPLLTGLNSYALGAAVKARTYNSFSDFTDDIDNSSHWFMPFDQSLQIGVYTVLGVSDGLYNWQFNRGEFVSNLSGYKTFEMSDSQQLQYFNSLVPNDTYYTCRALPELNVNTTYNYRISNTIMDDYHNLFLNLSNHTVFIVNDNGVALSSFGSRAAWFIYNSQYNTYTFNSGSRSFGSSYFTLSFSNTDNVLTVAQRIYDGFYSNFLSHYVFISDFIDHVYYGSDWESRIELHNDTDLNFSNDLVQYYEQVTNNYLLDIKGLLSDLVNTVDLHTTLFDNLFNLDGTLNIDPALVRVSVDLPDITIETQKDPDLPVNLNDIQEFTDNEYLDVVRERVDAFSDTVGSFVAFWHNTDYEIVYAVFGSALIVLLGAFIGKWGHS